jgi:Putative transposase
MKCGGSPLCAAVPGRYTHRVAISNHRLVSSAEQKVTFRRRDSADNNQQKLMTLPLDDFLCRFLLHLLPKISFASATSASLPTRGLRSAAALPASTRRASANTDRTSSLRYPATQSSLFPNPPLQGLGLFRLCHQKSQNPAVRRLPDVNDVDVVPTLCALQPPASVR